MTPSQAIKAHMQSKLLNFLKSIDVSRMMRVPDLYCVLQVGAEKGNVELFRVSGLEWG